jgi:hypothetical protein
MMTLAQLAARLHEHEQELTGLARQLDALVPAQHGREDPIDYAARTAWYAVRCCRKAAQALEVSR